MFKLAVERSRNAPLDLVCWKTEHCGAFVKTMLPLAHRWATLDIAYTEWLWAGAFSLHLPRLRYFVLNSFWFTKSVELKLEASGLASVKMISACPAYWMPTLSAWMGDRLRSLHLRVIHRGLYVDRLMNLIAVNPALEHLDLRWTKVYYPHPTWIPTVQAPYLRRIGLHYLGSRQITLDVISHLVLPTDASVALSFDVNGDPTIVADLDTRRLSQYIADRIKTLPTDSTILVYGTESRRLGFRCPSAIPNPHIDVAFYWGHGEGIIDPAFEQMVPLLKPVLCGQHELDLTTIMEYIQADVPGYPVFRSWGIEFAELNRLAIPSSADLLRLLINPLESERWMFPNLRHLQLTGRWQPQLLNLIRNRREDPAAQALESVTLRKAEVDSADLDSLTSLVSKVLITKGKHALYPVS
ncbi:hypothetical protein FRB90_000104 [Tulasnella sp. 427]|nr:hypothetical protein FRB90_000104 [Tulasnella sp. 427]